MLQSHTMKVFDISTAPDDLRNADDLAALRPDGGSGDQLLLQIRVGDYDSEVEGPSYDCITREVTFAEYQLHRWLIGNGAAEGETVLLKWSPV